MAKRRKVQPPKQTVVFNRCGETRLEQRANNRFWNFSSHQIQRINQIQKRTDFAYWTSANYAHTNGPPRKLGPLSLSWMDETGRLHVVKVGQSKDISTEFIV